MVARRRKTGKERKSGLILAFKTSACFFQLPSGYKKQYHSSAAFESEKRDEVEDEDIGWVEECSCHTSQRTLHVPVLQYPTTFLSHPSPRAIKTCSNTTSHYLSSYHSNARKTPSPFAQSSKTKLNHFPLCYVKPSLDVPPSSLASTPRRGITINQS